MELTFSDMKRRKRLNNEKKKKHLSQEMQQHYLEQRDRRRGPAGATVPFALGGVIAVFSNLLQSLLAEELTF